MPSPFDAGRFSHLTGDGIVADLHSHSILSDGKRTPAQVVDYALERGLCGVALCDHDRVGGSVKAIEYLTELEASGQLAHDIVTFHALEASTEHGGRYAHLLVFCPDPAYKPLHDRLERTVEERRIRTLKIVDLLVADGIQVSASDFDERGWMVNRSNLGRLLVERGHAPSVNWCFANLFGRKGQYFVERENEPDTLEIIELGLAAGGVPCIAHPAAYGDEAFLDEFTEAGMRGLEAFHPDQSARDSQRLLATAQRLGLFVSGGSDWHADEMHGSDLGGTGIDRERFATLVEQLPQDRVYHFKSSKDR